MPHYNPPPDSYDDGDFCGDDPEDDDMYGGDSDDDADSDFAGGPGPSNANETRSGRYSHHNNQRSDVRRYRNIQERGAAAQLDDDRRDHHNHLERKRRASIKGSYSELRDVIPSLRGSKASRAVTLQRAVEYIDTLTHSNHEHEACVEALKRQNTILEHQVRELNKCDRLELTEHNAPQATVERVTLTQSGPPTSFNTHPSLPQGNLSTPYSINLGISASNATSASTSIGGVTSSSATRVSAPVRVVASKNCSVDGVSNISEAAPPELSYTTLHVQQQSNPPHCGTPLSAVVTVTPPPVARLVTIESSSEADGSPAHSNNRTVQQRIRLSNSLSSSGVGRPVVVVPSCSTVDPGTFSALDTAVLKARASRPASGHVVVGSNVEVISSANVTQLPVSAGSTRRVVVVSAQNLQDNNSSSAPANNRHTPS